ncbi:hypothetical protein DRH27_04305 [Candidatus Falkowbacteria bacterium]|nr:MAG: hypothetical protein DRH27_04305 [Candidatus Falkowbacteria bacterium]
MILQLKYFLYVYYAFLVVWFLFFLISIYHILKFGFKNFTTFFMTFIFIGFALILLFISFNFIIPIDWKVGISIFSDIFKSNPIF